jgi:hypothetical protein
MPPEHRDLYRVWHRPPHTSKLFHFTWPCSSPKSKLSEYRPEIDPADKNKKSRRGGTHESVRPRRLTRQRTSRHSRVALQIVIRQLLSESRSRPYRGSLVASNSTSQTRKGNGMASSGSNLVSLSPLRIKAPVVCSFLFVYPHCPQGRFELPRQDGTTFWTPRRPNFGWCPPISSLPAAQFFDPAGHAVADLCQAG